MLFSAKTGNFAYYYWRDIVSLQFRTDPWINNDLATLIDKFETDWDGGDTYREHDIFTAMDPN